MPERVFYDPTLPPPGRRTGDGSESILRYLLKTLAARPQGPAAGEQGRSAKDDDLSSAAPHRDGSSRP